MYEGGFRLEVRPSGALRFRLPNGQPIPDAPNARSRGNVDEVIAANSANGLHITARTAVPDWGGEAMDHQLAVLELIQRE